MIGFIAKDSQPLFSTIENKEAPSFIAENASVFTGEERKVASTTEITLPPIVVTPDASASDYFENTLLPSVFKHEGGYSTDVNDVGNYLNEDTSSAFIGTNHGISAPVLAKFLGKKPTAQDMKALTIDEAKAIYKENYYTSFGIDILPQDLQEIVFNSVVNSGSNGIKVVQGLLGLKEDGVAGPNTKKAMANAKFTKKDFKDALLKKYSTFRTWKEHGKGWTKRFEKLAKD